MQVFCHRRLVLKDKEIKNFNQNLAYARLVASLVEESPIRCLKGTLLSVYAIFTYLQVTCNFGTTLMSEKKYEMVWE